MGKSIIGILLSLGIWEISYKYSSLFEVDLRRARLEEILEESISGEDELAKLLSLRKNCLPNTKQDKNANSRLKRPQGDCGKLDSLELLKQTL